MKKRNDRHDAIRSIVREERIKTQRELVDALLERGFTCTQATVSRDIKEMDVQKLGEGVYALAEDLHLKRMVTDLVTEVVQVGNLVIVKATTGAAPGVAAALDAADLPGALGTIAGDDTILVITDDERHAVEFKQAIERFKPPALDED